MKLVRAASILLFIIILNDFWLHSEAYLLGEDWVDAHDPITKALNNAPIDYNLFWMLNWGFALILAAIIIRGVFTRGVWVYMRVDKLERVQEPMRHAEPQAANTFTVPPTVNL